jgi:hypothetical protein
VERDHICQIWPAHRRMCSGQVDWSIDGRGSSGRPFYTVADSNESVTGSINEDKWQQAEDDSQDRIPVGTRQ